QIASIFSPTASINPVTGVVNAGLTVGGNSYGTVQAALDQISAGSYTGWTLSAGGRNATIGSGDTVALTSTSGNLTIAQNTDGNVELGFSDNPTFTSVKTGDTTIDTNGLTIANGPSIT
ncbi:hypothetical protein DLM20_25645, partial [Salmonella enterica subsp. enterica serovar Java]|nr:hypothetical protein [Salmonella enterica subsp. enterica serovar Java]